MITSLLETRSARVCDYAADHRAVVEFTHAMTESPASALQCLTDAAVRLTGGGSAGVSVIESDAGRPMMRWRATGGAIGRNVQSRLTPGETACGTVVSCDDVHLLRDPIRLYPTLDILPVPVTELLIVPCHDFSGRLIGAMWVMAHDPAKQFDREDVRRLRTLAPFVGAAAGMLDKLERARAAETAATDGVARAATVDTLIRHLSVPARPVSEHEFRTLADAMPQIVWAAEPDGRITYYNRQWFDYTGSAGPLADLGDIDWSGILPDEDNARVKRHWSACVVSVEPYEIEVRIRRASDGQYRWHLARGVPLRDERGAVVRWLGTSTDIHDSVVLKEQNAALLVAEQAARAEAERQSRMKDEFLATLGHELRTPLNAILGWGQILRADGHDAEERAAAIDVIERNARAQAQIIEDLLDMSSIISGKVLLTVKPTDLADALRAAMETVRPAADLKGVTLNARFDDLASQVTADANRLHQVFWNLLSNAVKFTPRGGRVDVSLGRVDSRYQVRVTDTGEGIRPEFLPFVFDRFRQADSTTTRQHGGLGLGLAIVRQLVELHGGTIGAASDGRGRGACFTVTLPLGAVLQSADPARPPSAGVVPARTATNDLCATLSGLRILVVDDEPDSRSMVRRVLENCDAVVTVAGSADEAVRAVQADRPDVLISDVGMPGEDGYSLIGRIRALESGVARLPAVALTAYARKQDRDRALAAGFQQHVAKPVEAAELIRTVAGLSRS